MTRVTQFLTRSAIHQQSYVTSLNVRLPFSRQQPGQPACHTRSCDRGPGAMASCRIAACAAAIGIAAVPVPFQSLPNPIYNITGVLRTQCSDNGQCKRRNPLEALPHTATRLMQMRNTYYRLVVAYSICPLQSSASQCIITQMQ
jgi:hypothetical protein